MTSPSPFSLKLIFRCAKGGFILFAIAFTVGMWQTGTHFFAELGQFLSLQDRPPQIDVSNILLEKLRHASELTTAVYTMETVVPAQQDRELMGMTVGTTKLLYVAYGEVKAGIDLTQITPADVQVRKDTVVVTLPPPMILDSKIDVTRSRVYDYDRGFLGLGPDVAPQLQTQAAQKTLYQMVTNACAEGVLLQASDRAQVAVKELLTLSGHTQVEIHTRPPNLESCRVPST